MFSIRRHANSIKNLKSGTCLFTVCVLAPVQAYAVAPDYDDLIMEARAGNRAPLLDYLQAQEKQTTLTANQVADWLQISGWADNNEETLKVWDRYHTQIAIPARGQIAVARALRNEKKWNQSLVVWENVLSEEPDNADARTGWIMTLADSRRNEQALTEATNWAQREPGPDRDALVAYVYHAQGKNWDAMLAASRAETEDPKNKDSRSTLIDALSANRVSGPALDLSENLSDTDPMKRRLELDAAAQTVRAAYTPTRNEEERFIVADKALARYDQLLAAWKNNPDAQADVRRARIDRIGALVIRKRDAEAIAEYESLEADGGAVPSYAKRWVATAWLNEEQPAKAEAMLMSIYYPNGPIATTPLSSDDQQDLFFAHLDNENFDAAKRQVDGIIKDSPYLRRVYGSPTPQPNDTWLLGQTLLTQYQVATNDLSAAEKHSERLARTGSGNQGLRITYASVLEARGLARKAEQELKLAEVIEPSNLELERQQAYVALDLQEWKQADELTDDVIARSPDDTDTLRLARIRDVHKMSELRLSGSQGIASDSPISGKHDFTLDSAIYSPPINDNWRLFTGFNFATGEFEEGKGISRDLAAGAEWTSRNYWAEMEISGHNYGDGQKIGGRLSAWHDFNDNWRIGGSAERLSRSTPLRALRNGVSANGGDGYIRWYQNERREYQLSFAASHFSDGNDRIEYGLSGKERLLTAPRFTLDFTPGIFGSTNSEENVPYYNPKRDLSVVPGLSAEHVLYRHYDTVWTQQITGAVGSYWQKNQGSGAITQLGYGQRIQWNNVVDGGVMLTWDKRPYDGKRERNISLAFDLNVRF
ncbi:poly-beta-1,6 N-acetyl-D-glucosamine export porin PgaA [Enterobacteriaceae bacterium H20N1]|uniref:Poly-beta-1,6 N-acetyl-D-glucosamine export porin PgaA n=1 Tax=Dryocola boscaweniae TaxID=2925397 RepID=A0A9X3AE81_9ENTR|nr:poly-beta-1,6 N-acetyl-D-glucosamine export porin PgaA [Dryocola boscaweniae]MCT4703848.1 poly-beta-1,6 N-acetyl-D-glucosamine export porin PgaA [Dryocola boscaweniae]MCT4721016.1 poly-beta-1,6 N-acetyl-D-glucosamine export porin PgaA [Dryocola boscaweniae]